MQSIPTQAQHFIKAHYPIYAEHFIQIQHVI
jgi:hypothetical protein